ncbi:hypothetical protein [Saccharomonospora sp. CUA-673]|uniref:hypothetical protein n=1 Tax=Saccharomonospora sp. CUA-673 TaxID=1904969 RepID=UPI001300D5FC|nr:hypothetical protein [Saccharomonospora sp. CUA-673]
MVQGVRHDPPDIHMLARVVASLATDMVEKRDELNPATADAADSQPATACDDEGSP